MTTSPNHWPKTHCPSNRLVGAVRLSSHADVDASLAAELNRASDLRSGRRDVATSRCHRRHGAQVARPHRGEPDGGVARGRASQRTSPQVPVEVRCQLIKLACVRAANDLAPYRDVWTHDVLGLALAAETGWYLSVVTSKRRIRRRACSITMSRRTAPYRLSPAGFRAPLAEPGVHLSLCTGLSIDDRAKLGCFACTARAARSGANPDRDRATHTWLSPAASALHPSTASLRHVRGSPALRLLRRLRPPFETSRDLAACRRSLDGARIEVPVFPGGTRGAVGGRLCPWQLGLHAKSGRGGSMPMAGTPSRLVLGDQALAAFTSQATSYTCLQRVQASTSPHGVHRRIVRHGTFGSPPLPEAVRTVQAARLLQVACPISGDVRGPPSAPGPTRARMTMVRSSVPPELHGA